MEKLKAKDNSKRMIRNPLFSMTILSYLLTTAMEQVNIPFFFGLEYEKEFYEIHDNLLTI
jgi:hypothetical protein